MIGDNYFSRPTTIIFTVFFQKNQWFCLLTSFRHLFTPIPPYETQKAYQILLSTKYLSDSDLHSGNPLNGYRGSL